MSSQIRSSNNDSVSTQPVWIYATFGAGDATGEELCVAASYDLKDWIPVGHYGAPLRSVRDPILLFHRGRWYCSYTESEGSTGTGTTFGLATSDDLIRWRLLAQIDLAPWLHGGPQRIWAPILAHDGDDEVYCVVMAAEDGRYLFLRPTDQDDLSTLQYVSDISIPDGPTFNSAFHFQGAYYIQGPTGAGRQVFRSAQPQGPYTAAGTIPSSGIDAMALFPDRDGRWYLFPNPQEAVAGAGGRTPVYAISEDGFDAFGSYTRTQTRSYINSPPMGYINPFAARVYGEAALSVRAALEEVLSTAQLSPPFPFPFWSVWYDHSGTDCDAFSDGAQGYAPFCRSGGVAGNKTVATVSRILKRETFATSTGFLADTGGGYSDFPIELNMAFWSAPQANAVNRILLGVPYNHQGPLDHAGVGFEMIYDGVPGRQKMSYVVHDGTTLTAPAAMEIPYDLTQLRVRIDGTAIAVWVNGKEWLRRFDVPAAAVLASNDGSYNATVIQSDCLSDGPQALFWLLGGSWQWFNH